MSGTSWRPLLLLAVLQRPAYRRTARAVSAVCSGKAVEQIGSADACICSVKYRI